jgi:hypothetical protein
MAAAVCTAAAKPTQNDVKDITAKQRVSKSHANGPH